MFEKQTGQRFQTLLAALILLVLLAVVAAV